MVKTKPIKDRFNKSIEQCLSHIQTNLNAPKNLHNKFGNYKYRSYESILQSVKPHLIETGCILTCSDELVLVGDRYYVKATLTLIKGENKISTTAFAREAEVKKGMDDSQITGAASSYARKYAANGLFAIDDTKDADHYDNSKYEVIKQKPEPITKDQKDKFAKLLKHKAFEATQSETQKWWQESFNTNDPYLSAVNKLSAMQIRIEQFNKENKGDKTNASAN
ncbi:MAG: putative essential recombination function protein [Prokaryotic dsDNA virus sp.]|nr:MAG: putative essential recombination function protein [Prokaryotic dsDNA virus sp.]|tara:strand:+ start:28012 stop:28680 length:669 start_codon:yes stop_codon:yes gene_type:complete